MIKIGFVLKEILNWFFSGSDMKANNLRPILGLNVQVWTVI